MIPQLIIHPDIEVRLQKINEILKDYQFTNPHPDLMFIENQKVGVEQTKQIREFLSFKPYQADKKVVVLVDAGVMSHDAQNSLLKTLEEPIGNTLIFLGVSDEDKLLATILSRCQIIPLPKNQGLSLNDQNFELIGKLIDSDILTRIKMIEKVEDRSGLLKSLACYFHLKLQKDPTILAIHEFSNQLILAQKYSYANVNPKTILEYLMLLMPSRKIMGDLG